MTVGDFGASTVMWGSLWAVGLFAIALWWGTGHLPQGERLAPASVAA
jgi:hypothetical protein